MKPARQFLVILLFCASTIYVAASDPKATKDLSTLPAAAQSTISAALGRDLPDITSTPPPPASKPPTPAER